MNAAADIRPIHRWLGSYAEDHRNATNQAIHVVCVPAILWAAIAMLWTIPVPGELFRPGAFAGLAAVLAVLYWWRLSRPLGLGMAAIVGAMLWSAHLVSAALGMMTLLWIGVGVFVVAWIGQFIGHKIEGKKPSFFTDLAYLLIGPTWVVAKAYRKLGWRI